MKTTKKIFLMLLIISLTICGWLGFTWWSFLGTPLIAKNAQSQNFVFAEGSSVKKAALSLKQQGLIKYPIFFTLSVRLSGKEHNLQAGEYVIEPGMTPRDLIDKMVKGDVLLHSFTIVEGWTFSQMIDALNKEQNVKHTIQGLKPEEIMERIGAPGEIPEGRFASDTYLFRAKTDDIYLLINAYNLMQKRLYNAWNNRSKDLPYNCPYEALIVASMIEKETALAKERTIISGVILRRLKKGMLLQVDPTVIYGLGEKYSGKLSKNDLTVDTPHNTYTRKGLPPSPIAMPSEDSIIAALHPDHGTSLYYVSKGDGSHEFSNTHEEQVKAIKKYIRGQAQQSESDS